MTVTPKQPRANNISRAAMANIRRLRKQHGWTMLDLVTQLRAIGCTTIEAHIIENLERGRGQRLLVDDAVWFARVFQIPLESLVDPAACPRCHGKPPDGFSCNACGVSAEAP